MEIQNLDGLCLHSLYFGVTAGGRAMLPTLRIAFKAVFVLGFVEWRKIFWAVAFDFVGDLGNKLIL